MVVVPDNLTLQDKAFVYITGNDNTDTVRISSVSVLNCVECATYSAYLIFFFVYHVRIQPPDNAKDEEILLVAALALATKSVTVVLYQIPNQPIVYTADPLQKKRGEDANIAFTWRHFHDHPDQPGMKPALKKSSLSSGGVRGRLTLPRQRGQYVCRYEC